MPRWSRIGTHSHDRLASQGKPVRASSATLTHMGVGEVSVRELRQNLSVYLRRVKEGATLAVTSRGERVAVLAPIAGGSRVDRLIAEGRVTVPPHAWSPLEAAAGGGVGPTLTDALLAMRDEDAR